MEGRRTVDTHTEGGSTLPFIGIFIRDIVHFSYGKRYEVKKNIEIISTGWPKTLLKVIFQ